jgi:hypothetical protein
MWSDRKILGHGDDSREIEESKNPTGNPSEIYDFTFDDNGQFPNRLGVREN